MFKWLIALFLVLLVTARAGSWLERIGIGKLPGDFRFRCLGKQIFLPFTSTVLLSLAVWGISKIL
jgi:hypothetical protein